jgi:hypothetical protein
VKVLRSLLLLIVLYPFQVNIGQDIQFYREDITFELSKDHFKVNGNYYFRNLNFDPVKTKLIYPFPTDSIYSCADSVFALDVLYKNDKLMKVTSKAAAIELTINPFDTTVLNIGYKQKLKSGRAEYILTTTKGWGKAFESAKYNLVTDTSLVIRSFSYEPDTSYLNDDKYFYYWEKKAFLPEMDFIILFDQK